MMSQGRENRTATRVGRKAPTKYCPSGKTYINGFESGPELGFEFGVVGGVVWGCMVTVPTASQN